MTPVVPVVDLEAADLGAVAQLDAIRAGTEDLGAIQVVRHGVPQDLIDDLNRQMAQLLSLPRAEKAKLASPHPYRGWRQWPDDFGRLELERFEDGRRKTSEMAQSLFRGPRATACDLWISC